ncbi:MAG: sensor histidine kinase, partial [Micrococcales bacterium]
MAASPRVTLSNYVSASLGPQLFGVWTLLLSFAFSFFARITPIPGDPVLSLQDNLWINLVSGLAAYAFLQVVTRPLLLLRAGRRTFAVISVFLAGAVRGFALYGLIGMLANHSGNSIVFRLSSSGILYGLTLLIASYSVGALQSRVAMLQQLREVSYTLEQEISQNQQRIDGWYQSLALNLKARLRREVDRHLGSAEAAVASGLKDHVAEVVRPLSQELMNQMPEWTPPASTASKPLARQILSSTLDLEWKVYPLLTSSLGALVSLSAFIQFIGVRQYPVLVLAIFANWVGYHFGNIIYKSIQRGRSWRVRAVQFVLLFTVFNLPSSLIAVGALAEGIPPITLWLRALLLSFALALAGLLISVSRALQRALVLDAVKLEELNRELKWLAARTSSLMWERQRDLSRILHGPVQSALAAAAIRLDLAKDDPAQVSKIVDESRSSIIAAINEITDGERENLDITKGFARVIEGWDGVSQVVVGLSNGLETRINADPSCARIVFDIVQEAVANSARHGEAKNVVVTIAEAGDKRVSIEVRDDGKGMGESLKPGLGTR